MQSARIVLLLIAAGCDSDSSTASDAPPIDAFEPPPRVDSLVADANGPASGFEHEWSEAELCAVEDFPDSGGCAGRGSSSRRPRRRPEDLHGPTLPTREFGRERDGHSARGGADQCRSNRRERIHHLAHGLVGVECDPDEACQHRANDDNPRNNATGFQAPHDVPEYRSTNCILSDGRMERRLSKPRRRRSSPTHELRGSPYKACPHAALARRRVSTSVANRSLASAGRTFRGHPRVVPSTMARTASTPSVIHGSQGPVPGSSLSFDEKAQRVLA